MSTAAPFIDVASIGLTDRDPVMHMVIDSALTTGAETALRIAELVMRVEV